MKGREGSEGIDLFSLFERPDCCEAHAADGDGSNWGETEEEDTVSGGESETEEQYFSVTCDPSLGADGDAGSFGMQRVEEDIIAIRCRNLRRMLRKRPCLPLKRDGEEPFSTADLATGVQLPLYTCPFEGCRFHTADRQMFLHHVAGGVSDVTHLRVLQDVCGDCKACWSSECCDH